MLLGGKIRVMTKTLDTYSLLAVYIFISLNLLPEMHS